ncbi:MAG: terminase small subunit [Candidatus Thorarchaeota archaeon]|jgi:phage terminase small subunit
MAKLTERQRKFVLYYEGDGQSAAIKAGYAENSARITASKLLTQPNIQKALAKKNEQIATPLIASLIERKEILSEIARQTDHKDRVKATDVLNKMDSIYIQKHEIKNWQNKSEEEIIQAVIKDLESRGYKVIAPK